MATAIILFIFGAAIGSFLDVVARRYDPDRFLFSQKVIGGRSFCESCGKTLRWFELVPLASFLLQRGRCAACGVRLSFEYPVVETLSGLIFIFAPAAVRSVVPFAPQETFILAASLWVIALLFILLLSLIDIRLHIIPDEITVILAVLGAVLAYVTMPYMSDVSGSFIGSYALLLGVRGSVILNRFAGLGFGVLLFGSLVAFTRGRGMGMGDAKLAAAFGILFGWPDVAAISLLAFVIGAIAGTGVLLSGKGGMKSLLPFGPFLAIAAALVFFFGAPIAGFYFGLAGL